MDRTRRVLSLLLALCMMLCVLVACGDKGDTVENKDSEEIVARLLVSNLSKYSIIVPEGGASDGMAEALNELMMLFEERWGITLKLRDDFVVEGMPEFSEGQYEILVGETNRKESAEVFTDVKKCDDYEVRMSGDKLVIVGYNEAQLAVAIRSVIDEINAIPEDADYFFDESMQISFKGTYAIGEILIGETDISKYTVVYKHGDVCKALATMMADKILEKTGYSLNVVDDENASDEGKKILIGNTKFNTVDMPDEDGYYIGVDVDNISLCSTTVSGICKAVTHFIDLVDSATGDTVTLDLDLGLVMSEDTSMTSMSFNVYVGNQTTERKNRVIKMIERYMPDTLGVQEANNSWINALNNALGDTYAYVGIGRNSTSESADGERCAIFYKKDKFNLLDSGTQWLSDTPEQVSKYPDSTYYRIFTYALLERKSDGKQFMHVNTHLDNEALHETKLKQATVITNFIKSYNKDVPIIFTGDFNCNVGALAGKHILASGFDDSSAVAIGSNGSLGGIDIIFTSNGDFTVYEIIRDSSQIDGAPPSDHSPVIAKFDFK